MSDPVYEQLASTAKAMRGVADTLDTAVVNHSQIPDDVAGVAHGGDVLDATADLLEAITRAPLIDPAILAAAEDLCGAFWTAMIGQEGGQ